METLVKLVILIIFVHNHFNAVAQCHIDDWTALKAFYDIIDPDNWDGTSNNEMSWDMLFANQSTPPANCDLNSLIYGPELNEFGRVEELIFNTPLAGLFPSEIAGLSHLRVLHLTETFSLKGNIPPEIGELSNLETLIIISSIIEGGIPPEIGNLTNLKFLVINSNYLMDGNIPAELGNLNNLEYLDLSLNALSGNIPPELGSLNNLTVLRLGANNLSGNIPPELGNLTNLTELDLQLNFNLSGNIPSELANLSNLTDINLSGNNLTGCYHPNLIKLCQLPINNSDISDDNYFDSSWEYFCFIGACTGNCPSNWTIVETTFDYYSSNIESSGTINTYGNVIIDDNEQQVFRANRIQLNTGFKVKAGVNRFTATHGGCN